MNSIVEQLRRDEGWRDRGYKDSRGRWAIGCGHDIESGPPLTDAAIELILENDLRMITDELARRAPWVLRLSPIRHAALINMAFNIGVSKLLSANPKMCTALQHDAYELAAAELLDGPYKDQVGQRAFRLAEQLRTGVWK